MSVTAPKGFRAAGVHCGVKADGRPDLAVVATVAAAPVAAAATFTANKMTAAPVLVSADHLATGDGRAAAVVLNSGNANAATGAAGIADAERMCADVATALGCEHRHVLVCSTGLIGYRLPIEAISAGVPGAVAALGSGSDSGAAAAEAIRTTDTHRKEVTVSASGFTVGGMAKGAAMLAPSMATMLAVLTTDAVASPTALRAALGPAVDASFNRLSTDGCQSTNDTVIVLASGSSGHEPDADALTAALTEAAQDLAAQMAGDAEGATKVVRLTVRGAADDVEALVGARKVAASALCKCSWYGQDPYWGRIASELGAAGIEFDQRAVSVSYGGVTVASGGVTTDHDDAAVARHMAERHLEIVADLGVGSGQATVLTNDLTHAYVDENMGTS